MNGDGDVEAVLADCDIVLDRTYHTRAFSQAMMETFRTYTEMDRYGRLHVISSHPRSFSTAGAFLSHALGIPKSRIRVEKPRIGGGFGAKQTAVCEVYPAFVTLQTGRAGQADLQPARKRRSPAPPGTRWRCASGWAPTKTAASAAFDLYNPLSTPGAYGEHGPTTVGLSRQRSTATALATTWSTPTCRRQAPTAATAPPRAFLRWKAS